MVPELFLAALPESAPPSKVAASTPATNDNDFPSEGSSTSSGAVFYQIIHKRSRAEKRKFVKEETKNQPQTKKNQETQNTVGTLDVWKVTLRMVTLR